MPVPKDILNLGKRLASRMAPTAQTTLKKSGEFLKKTGKEVQKFGAGAVQSFQDTKTKQAAEKAEEDSFRIPPWYILAGLGSLERRTLCDYLAVFECASPKNLALDGARDLLEKLEKSEQAEKERAFLRRVQDVAKEYREGTNSPRSDAWLRFRMWNEMRAALDLPKTLPLSTDSANAQCAEVGDLASRRHNVKAQPEDKDKEPGQKFGKFAAESFGKIQDRIARRRPDFTRTVRKEAHAMVLQALKGGNLNEEQQGKIKDEFLRKMTRLPEHMRDQSLEQAIRAGDGAGITAAMSAITATGLVAAVEIAGFSAYVAAAKISAIIPLLGGKTAVSLLAVLANPLFAAFAVTGSTIMMDRALKKSIGRTGASKLAILLALQGLASRSDGLKRCLDDFKNLTDDEISNKQQIEQRATAKRASSAWLPAPGTPKTNLPAIQKMQGADPLMATLFPDPGNSTLNVAAVAGLTAADILFDAIAINPQALAAADFSRVEDIDNIFTFGAFAQRIESMEGAAQAGAENQLRGYVAEMMVATRLREHDVRFPETSNNPGHDLLVDGQPFQVKCSGNPDAGMHMLEKHFEQYPDTPVYANSELVHAVRESDSPWADKVFGVEGFDYETTNRVMEQSLESGADLMDVPFPFFAVAVSAARNIHGWWKGSVPLRDLPLEAAVDGAIHGSLSAAGGFAGGGIGLLLFGPAGAVIFGGTGQAAALFGASTLRRTFDDLRTKKWAASVDNAADAFKTALNKAMHSKIRSIHSKASQVNISDPAMEDWVRLKFADRALGVAECTAELDFLPNHPVDRASALLTLMRKAGVHPWSVNEPLKNLMNILAQKPRVTEQAVKMGQQATETVTDQVTRAFGKGKQWYGKARSGDAP